MQLKRDNTGQNALWEMNVDSLKAAFNLQPTDPSWQVADLLDVDGDGKSDILWRNANGAAAVWEMNGGQILAGANLPAQEPAWRIVDHDPIWM